MRQAQLQDQYADLLNDPSTAAYVVSRLDLFPAVPAEDEHVIRCSLEGADVAVCRALARACVWREAWRVEVIG